MATTDVSTEVIKKRQAILDKTTTQDMQQKWEEESREEIEQAKSTFMPPVIVEKKCKVCTSAHREYIEWMLVRGHYSYEAIERSVPDDKEGKKPSRKSIANHYKQHMKIEDSVVRAELEEEAENLGKPVSKGIHKITTERGILRVLIQKAFADAQAGIIRIEAKDLLAMMKLMRDIEEKSSDVKSDQADMYLRIFLTAVQNIFSEDQQIELQKEIKRLREEGEIEISIEDDIPAIEEAKVVDDEV